MTQKEFNKIIPGKTVIKAIINEEPKEMLVKCFLCNPENYDGYWLCCTEDMTNPYPYELKEDDWNIYADKSEIVRYE